MGASESKLEFKEDIFRLVGDDNIALESPWWERFIQLPETAEDVQALWSTSDLRSLLLNTTADRPRPNTQVAPKKNAETLIYRTISRLHALQTKRVFDYPLTPIAPEVLNGVRILTRLLPYIYEADHLVDWEGQFFWQSRRPVSYVDSKTNIRTYRDGLSAEIIPEEKKDQVIGPPLGEQLTDILVNYLFFPGFTLPPKKDANGLPELKPIYTVWQSGIGANKGAAMTKENEKNATEVLRLLLALCSRPMYIAPNVVAEKDIKPLTCLTTQADRTVVLNTICSLLNTVLKYNQSSWTFSIDLAAGTKDPKQFLVTYCLHFLLILVTYPVPDSGANEFRKALGRLHRAEDFQFIGEGLRQILMPPVSGMFRPVQRLTTTVPPIAPETLSLFWELLQCNKRFRSYLIDTDRARDFVVLVLYYAVDSKDDPAKQGVLRMCIFILQTLSVEEKFGQKLNSPFTFQETLPSVLQIPNFHGSYADFLIGHIHGLLTHGNRGLESLHPALLAIINNIAPYVQDLQRATSSMLVNLFVSMSQPSFLLANETNHTHLSSLLDAMNAILEHHFEANQRLVEIVVRERKRFEALHNFTVDGALDAIDQIKMERKDAGAGSRQGSVETPRESEPAGSTSPIFAIDDESEEDASTGMRETTGASSATAMDAAASTRSERMSEKARGKRPAAKDLKRSDSPSSSNYGLNTNLHPSDSPLSSNVQQSFTPSQSWLNEWLPFLPLHLILQIIKSGGTRRQAQPAAVPERAGAPERASAATVDTNTSADTPTVASTKPDPFSGEGQSKRGESRKGEINVQTFRWSSLALGWYASLLWGMVYKSDSGRVWVGTHIKLFNVLSQRQEVSLRSPRGAVDAVGNTLVQRLGSINLRSPMTSREV